MRPQARREYLAQMRGRYRGASKAERGRLPTEAVTVNGLPSEDDYSSLPAMTLPRRITQGCSSTAESSGVALGIMVSLAACDGIP